METYVMVIGSIFILCAVSFSIWGEKLLFKSNSGGSPRPTPEPPERPKREKPRISEPVISFLNKLYKEPHLFKITVNPDPYRFHGPCTTIIKHFHQIYYKDQIVGEFDKIITDYSSTTYKIVLPKLMLTKYEEEYLVHCIEEFYKKRLKRVDNIKRIRENRINQEMRDRLTEQFR